MHANSNNTQQLECSGSSSCYSASLNNTQQLQCRGSSSCRSGSLRNAQHLECIVALHHVSMPALNNWSVVVLRHVIVPA